MSRRDRDPGALSPREAVQRYLRRRQPEATESSMETWKYRLKLFVEWCEGIGIERVDEFKPFDIDEYYDLRSGSIEPATLKGEMWTLKGYLQYLDEQLGAVEADLHEAVRIPDLDKGDEVNETTLPTEDALPLIEFYRGSSTARGTRAHAFIELAWYIGARQGGLRALDVRDVNLDEEYVEFHHRPETGTPLKNKRDGERPVALPEEVVEVLGEFIDSHRYDVRDDHDRQPLLASTHGRPEPNTIRVWSYRATQPCLHSPCPHGKERETCEMTKNPHASKCPSSRSPHKIRSGSITWQLNCGVPPEIVAERVNASVGTIKSHYDFATAEERWRRYHDQMESRREHLDQFDFTDDDNDSIL